MKLEFRTTLAFAFFIIATVPVVILALSAEQRWMEKELALVSEKHLLLASNAATALDRYARDSLAVFDYLTSDRERLTSDSGQKLGKAFGFRSIRIVDGNDRIVAKSDFEEAPASLVPSAVLSRIRARANADSVFSEVLKTSDGHPAIFIVRRVFEDELAFGALRLDYFRKLQTNIIFGRKGHAAIVDAKGNIIAHPQPDWQQEGRNISDVKPVAEMLEGKSGVVRFHSPAVGQEMITGYTIIPSTGWGVMVPQPLDELAERASDLRHTALGVILIGLVAVGIIGWVLSGLVSQYLHKFKSALCEYSEGDFATRFSVPPGFLAAALAPVENSLNRVGARVAAEINERQSLELSSGNADRPETDLPMPAGTNEKREQDTRRFQRLAASQIALVNFRAFSHPAHVEDISVGGVRMRNADNWVPFSEHFEIGDAVIVMIDGMSPLDGQIVRVQDQEMTIKFEHTVLWDEDRIAVQIMSLVENFIHQLPQHPAQQPPQQPHGADKPDNR
ncbi:MAG: Cache 3/Cache 2 fusion domain-containing protein [Rickettsiales bacterium]